MRKILNMIKKDDNAYSVGRVCAVVSFIVWCGVSIWLAAFSRTWGNYESFTLGMVALLLVQLGNKAIETRAFKISNDERRTQQNN